MILQFVIQVLAAASLIVGCNAEHSSLSKGTKMTESGFWQIIEQSRGPGGDAEHSQRLAAVLKEVGPSQLIEFHLFYRRFFDEAGRDDIRAAGMLINGGHGTDDGFEYFRNWLIGQERETYERAISNPDSLAESAATASEQTDAAEWEHFGYVARDVYQQLTQQDLHAVAKNFDLLSEATAVIDYSDEMLAQRLPGLYAKYGATRKRFLEARSANGHAVKSLAIDGFGTVHVGEFLVHRKLGRGEVRSLAQYGASALALVQFADKERPMALGRDHADEWIRPERH